MVTDEQIRELRSSQPVNGEFLHIFNDCVRALGTDPVRGVFLLQKDIDEAKRRVADHIELRDLRAAKRADEERIRAVVDEAARIVIDGCYYDDLLQSRAIPVHGNDVMPGSVKTVASAIASRVASQLAGSVAHPPSVAALISCLRRIVHSDMPSGEVRSALACLIEGL